MRKRKLLWIVLVLLASARLASWSGKKQVSESLCAEMAAGESGFRGCPTLLPSGLFELSGAVWEGRGKAVPFAGTVVLGPAMAGVGPAFGRQVEISGRFRCANTARNPGMVADGLWIWTGPRVRIERGRRRLLPETASLLSRVPFLLSRWLDRRFVSAPGWLAVERAVWLGDLSRLPSPLLVFYRDAGLLHVLAPGGQRVQSLIMVCLFALWMALSLIVPIGCWRFAGRWFPLAHRALPCLACGLLALTTYQAAPLRRVLAMAVALFALRARRLSASPLQIACSSIACLVVWEPSLVGKTGFLLSAAATVLLCRIAEEGAWRSAVQAYLAISLAMPVLVFPLAAFSFARLSWLAPLHGIAIGWAWYWILAPLAFVVPLLLFLLPAAIGGPIVVALEKFWAGFCAVNLTWAEHVAVATHSVIRPTWGELILAECLLVLVVAQCQKVFFPPSPFADVK